MTYWNSSSDRSQGNSSAPALLLSVLATIIVIPWAVFRTVRESFQSKLKYYYTKGK